LVSTYESYLHKTGKTTSNTRERVHQVARFLQFVEQNGCEKLSDLSVTCIYDAFNAVINKGGFRKSIGAFLRYAKTYGLVAPDLIPLMPEVPRHVGIPTVYSIEEIEQLLASIDRLTLNGKRDYAIILIGARLGLRACDIANMTVDCLHWENHIIELVQAKTKRPLKLPMIDEVESALYDYINNGRPQATSGRIFLCRHGYGAVSPHLISMIVRRAFKRSGIEIGNRKHGPHALRSSLATALLHEGNDYPTIQKVLGHNDIQSTKSYARADVELLRDIAIQAPMPEGTFAELLKMPVNSKQNPTSLHLLVNENESHKGVAE
jgi:site-specific recombinase XerD